MWSLGIVALTLLTHHLDVRLEGLDRMGQQQLDEFLEQNILQAPAQFSPNCESFVRHCLLVSPDDRISASGALCHDWLCTPETHLTYFEELERRSSSSWKPARHLQPMPLHLPDVTDRHLSLSETHQGLRLGSRLAPWWESLQDWDESSEYFHGQVRLEPKVSSGMAVENTSRSSHRCSTMDSVLDGSVTETSLLIPMDTKHQAGRAGQGAGSSAGQPSILQEGKSKRKAQDTALLPLNNFEKPSGSGHKFAPDQREEVLEELRRAKALFVPDIPNSSTAAAAPNGGRERAQARKSKSQRFTSASSPALFR